MMLPPAPDSSAIDEYADAMPLFRFFRCHATLMIAPPPADIAAVTFAADTPLMPRLAADLRHVVKALRGIETARMMPPSFILPRRYAAICADATPPLSSLLMLLPRAIDFSPCRLMPPC